MYTGLLVVASIAIALTDGASIRRILDKATDVCDSKVYCTGDLLKVVQLAELFNDSKTFVDHSQRQDPDTTLSNFNKLMKATNGNPTRPQLALFVTENFVLDDELKNATLPDWHETPSILKRIQDRRYREWAKALNDIWPSLARIIEDDVAVNPDRHSLIYVKNHFIIPGGRFREYYYWDSYWVIEGLLLCDMYQTAKGMIENFVSLVERYGFIPNGGRVYYLMRSQPPLLIPMVARYLDFTKDYGFLSDNIATLEKEFAFWQRNKMIRVKKGGKYYNMARYIVNSPSPRPESYKEDYRMAQQLDVKLRDEFYNDIKAGAESGWDFSNRWYILENKNQAISLFNISTQNVVPVDLNAFLQRNARYLSDFHTRLGNKLKAQYYAKIAAAFQAGIDNVLWNEEKGTWFDYDIKNARQRTSFYPSNLTPLYTKSYDLSKVEHYTSKTISYLKAQKVDAFFGGTPTSLNYTGEQWDFPNAWPPLQSIIIMGLRDTGVKEGIDMAQEFASRWLSANYAGYAEYGKMFEKYDATAPGQGGGGGEYALQEGFGWTNGIVYEFLNAFPSSSLEDSNNNDFGSRVAEE